MDREVLQWILGVLITVVVGIAGGLYLHTKEDSKRDERLATLEERSREHGTEIRSLRDMRHEIIEQCTHSISNFYVDAMKKLDELKEWVREKLK